MPATGDDTVTDEKGGHYEQASREEFVHGKPSYRVGWSKGYMPLYAL
jgi:hypothetical protein